MDSAETNVSPFSSRNGSPHKLSRFAARTRFSRGHPQAPSAADSEFQQVCLSRAGRTAAEVADAESVSMPIASGATRKASRCAPILVADTAATARTHHLRRSSSHSHAAPPRRASKYFMRSENLSGEESFGIGQSAPHCDAAVTSTPTPTAATGVGVGGLGSKPPALPTFPRCNLSASSFPVTHTASALPISNIPSILSVKEGSRSSQSANVATAANAASHGEAMVMLPLTPNTTGTMAFPNAAENVRCVKPMFSTPVSSCASPPPPHAHPSSLSAAALLSPLAHNGAAADLASAAAAAGGGGAAPLFNVSSVNFNASTECAPRFQTSYCGTGYVSVPRRGCLMENGNTAARRSHMLSLDSSAASSVAASIIAQPDDHTHRALPHVHSPASTRHMKKASRRTLSVFMVLDDVVVEDIHGTDTHNPLRFPSRGRGAAGHGLSRSHSQRRCVVSVTDGTVLSSTAASTTTTTGLQHSTATSASAVLTGAVLNFDALAPLGSPHSVTSMAACSAAGTRQRFATPITGAQAHAVPLHVSLTAVALPAADTLKRFSLCSQLVNGGGAQHQNGSLAGRHSHSCLSEFLRSQSSDWNVSPGVSAAPVMCGPGRDRRTRPRWQISSRVAAGSGCGQGTNVAAEVGMDESAFPIINFDFEQMEE